MPLYAFPSWQWDTVGVDMIIGGKYDGNGQHWQQWSCPNVWMGEFLPVMVMAFGSKPTGPGQYIPNAYWDDADAEHINLRVPGYEPPETEDFTGMDPREGKLQAYRAGFEAGIKEGKFQQALESALEPDHASDDGSFSSLSHHIVEGKGKRKG